MLSSFYRGLPLWHRCQTQGSQAKFGHPSLFDVACKSFKWCAIWCLRVNTLLCVSNKQHHLIFTQNFINILVSSTPLLYVKVKKQPIMKWHKCVFLGYMESELSPVVLDEIQSITLNNTPVPLQIGQNKIQDSAIPISLCREFVCSLFTPFYLLLNTAHRIGHEHNTDSVSIWP